MSRINSLALEDLAKKQPIVKTIAEEIIKASKELTKEELAKDEFKFWSTENTNGKSIKKSEEANQDLLENQQVYAQKLVKAVLYQMRIMSGATPEEAKFWGESIV
jgi:hypothetical protein